MNTKLLKQKILDLAIHGKLVPQNPDDEPASQLLRRISEEKEKLIAQGKIKRPKKSDAINSAQECPFEIPNSWEWCKVEKFAYVASGSTPQKDAFVNDGIPYLKMYNVRNQKVDFEYKPQYITEEVHNGKLQRSRTEVGDLLMNIVGPPLGKLAIIPPSLPQCNFNQAAVLIRPYAFKDVLVKYLFYYLSEMSEINSISTKGTAGQDNISLTQAQNMRVPLPPLAEQQRIVSAIEKWFSLIDEIETNKESLQAAIKQTKSKVLDLAINGKLVSQDPNDEPASELLKRINKEKENLIAQGKIKRSKQSDAVNAIQEFPFEIPDSWEWVKLGEIAMDMSDGPFGSNLKKEHYTDKREARIIQLSNIGEDGWREDNTRYTTFSHATNNICRSIVQPGDLVIAKMMPAGRTIICPNHEKMFVLSSDAIKLVLYKEIDKKLVLDVLNSSFCRKRIGSGTQGIGRERTSIIKLKNLHIPLPPLSEQTRIVSKIEEVFALLDEIERELA